MIGVFDSGLGGLTVVKEIFRQLPGYGVVYFGDTARMPYGNKSRKMVTKYALQDAEFLVSHGAKIIVVACNTASALAMDELRRKIRVPLFEVVTPAVARAAQVSCGRTGVIGTRGTVKSGVYAVKMRLVSPKTKVMATACPLFVPLVEEGWLNRPETLMIAKRYLHPLRWRKIDSLILGCTHYPFLRPIVRQVMGSKVVLVDPARETVSRLKHFLRAQPDLDKRLNHNGRRRFFVSDRTEQFSRLASHWLGGKIKLEESQLE
jgi:glutamate racemase